MSRKTNRLRSQVRAAMLMFSHAMKSRQHEERCRKEEVAACRRKMAELEGQLHATMKREGACVVVVEKDSVGYMGRDLWCIKVALDPTSCLRMMAYATHDVPHCMEDVSGYVMNLSREIERRTRELLILKSEEIFGMRKPGLTREQMSNRNIHP